MYILWNNDTVFTHGVQVFDLSSQHGIPVIVSGVENLTLFVRSSIFSDANVFSLFKITNIIFFYGSRLKSERIAY